MPINIPNGLPAKQILESEKIFVLEEDVVRKQDIRPLRIVILNLMPKKIETETQILRLISKSPLQVDIDFTMVSNHVSKNTSADHLSKFHDNFSTLEKNRYDCLTITDAPVEHLEFEGIDYWDELYEIVEWSKTHVYSTLHICWDAQTGLYYHYHIQKHLMKQKVFDTYPQALCDEYNSLTNDFDETHYTPHSRHAIIGEHALAKQEALEILSRSDVTGSSIAATRDFREIYILGHLEYDKETPAQEYFRNLSQGKEIQLPFNYFSENGPQQEPVLTWRSHASLLYRNWLNYVYQMTPYNL